MNNINNINSVYYPVQSKAYYPDRYSNNTGLERQIITPYNTQPKKYKRPLINSQNTGYLAVGSTLLTIFGGKLGNKFLKNHHKKLGYLTGGLVLLHLISIRREHIAYKKSNLR